MVGMMGKYIYMMREQPEENTPERECVCESEARDQPHTQNT